MGTDRVEVAQQHDSPAGIGFSEIAQDLFDHQLGAAIRVGGAGGEIFPQRYRGRIAVNGGRGAEHQPEHAGPGHLFAQHQGAGHVVLIVGKRDLAGFPTALRPAKWITDAILCSANSRCRQALSRMSPSTKVTGLPVIRSTRLSDSGRSWRGCPAPRPAARRSRVQPGYESRYSRRPCDQNCHYVSRVRLKLGAESTRPAFSGKERDANDALNSRR